MDGPRQVRDILSELGVDPDTVLVIRDRALLTREERLDDADEIEIRPVISGGARGGSSRPGDTRPGSDSERTPRWKEGGGRVIGK
jgi:sulfur carrier protein